MSEEVATRITPEHRESFRRSSGLVVHPDDAAVWIPVLVADVNPDGRWVVRCPDCGRPNDHGPEVGFRHSHCHCEGMTQQRDFDGYVIAPPGAWHAPYPDFCRRCRDAGRSKIYTPVELEPSPSGHLVGFYNCDYSHGWSCNWGDEAQPGRPTFRAGKRTALYRHFDEAGVLLYVGITDDLVSRGKSHARDSRWVEFATRCEAVWFDSREEAEHEERRAIQVEDPVFNFAHALTPQDDRIRRYLASLASR